MKLGPIVARLKEQGLKRVYGVLELAGLDKHPGALPAYFVVPQGWNAGPNRLSGAIDQRTDEAFAVVLLLDGAARREDGVSDALDDEEKKVVDALIGWTPPGASRACEAAGGDLLSVSGTTVSSMVRFRTGGHIRKVD